VSAPLGNFEAGRMTGPGRTCIARRCHCCCCNARAVAIPAAVGDSALVAAASNPTMPKPINAPFSFFDSVPSDATMLPDANIMGSITEFCRHAGGTGTQVCSPGKTIWMTGPITVPIDAPTTTGSVLMSGKLNFFSFDKTRHL